MAKGRSRKSYYTDDIIKSCKDIQKVISMYGHAFTTTELIDLKYRASDLFVLVEDIALELEGSD